MVSEKERGIDGEAKAQSSLHARVLSRMLDLHIQAHTWGGHPKPGLRVEVAQDRLRLGGGALLEVVSKGNLADNVQADTIEKQTRQNMEALR